MIWRLPGGSGPASWSRSWSPDRCRVLLGRRSSCLPHRGPPTATCNQRVLDPRLTGCPQLEPGQQACWQGAEGPSGVRTCPMRCCGALAPQYPSRLSIGRRRWPAAGGRAGGHEVWTRHCESTGESPDLQPSVELSHRPERGPMASGRSGHGGRRPEAPPLLPRRPADRGLRATLSVPPGQSRLMTVAAALRNTTVDLPGPARGPGQPVTMASQSVGG